MLKNKLNITSLINRLKQSPTIINIITVGIITVIVKGFGFYKEIVIASNFGLSELLDTFFIALLIPGFVNEVFLNAFKSVFIPNYIAEQKATKNIGSFQSTSFLITIMTAILFMIVAYLFTDVYLDVFFGGHTEGYYQFIKIQFYYLLPCIMIWGLTSLISGLLHIHNEFKYSTVYPILTSISMLICLIFYKEELQEVVLAVGLLIGSIAQFILLLAVALHKKVIKLDIPDFKSQNTIIMFKQVPAKVSSGFLTGLIPLTDQFFAAQLVIGSIAALNYGLKIPAFLSTIVLIALGNVLLPYFSKLNISNTEIAFKNLYKILKWTFITTLIIALIASLFSNSIVEVLFERGNFTSENTVIVSQIQIIFLIGVPFLICENILVKFLTSINKNTFMAYVSLGSFILNVILDFLLMKYYGIIGIALCTTVIEIIKISVFLKYANIQKKKMLNLEFNK